MAFASYNMGHDEWDSATKKLEQWERARNPNMSQTMPIGFGPMASPSKQRSTSGPGATFTTASVKFKTSRTFLQNLFPTTAFKFKGPGTVCYASWSQTTFTKVQSLGGSGYSSIGLHVHGVEYTKQDGTVIEGTYLPLVLENLADTIISGRDEIGLPKVFCNINTGQGTDSYSIRCSWNGVSFMSIDIANLMQGEGSDTSESDGLLVYKYIPATPGADTKPGAADAAYPVFIDRKKQSGEDASKITKKWTSGHASIKVTASAQEDLPTLHHIVSKLQEMPVFEVVECEVVEGTGAPDVSAAQRIE